MRRKPRAGGRTVLGFSPLLALVVVAIAVATAVLQNAGFDQWWALPAVLVAVLSLGGIVPRDPPAR